MQRPSGSPSIGETSWTSFTITPSAGTSLAFTELSLLALIGKTGSVGAQDFTASWTLYASTSSSNTPPYYSDDFSIAVGSARVHNLACLSANTCGMGVSSDDELALTWPLGAAVGTSTGAVTFIVDVVVTGETGGHTSQRWVGYQDLEVTASVQMASPPPSPPPPSPPPSPPPPSPLKRGLIARPEGASVL